MLVQITLYIKYFAWGCTRYLLAWCIHVVCLQWSRINEFVLGLKSIDELCHSLPLWESAVRTLLDCPFAQGGFCMDNPNLQPVRNNPAWVLTVPLHICTKRAVLLAQKYLDMRHEILANFWQIYLLMRKCSRSYLFSRKFSQIINKCIRQFFVKFSRKQSRVVIAKFSCNLQCLVDFRENVLKNDIFFPAKTKFWKLKRHFVSTLLPCHPHPRFQQ